MKICIGLEIVSASTVIYTGIIGKDRVLSGPLARQAN